MKHGWKDQALENTFNIIEFVYFQVEKDIFSCCLPKVQIPNPCENGGRVTVLKGNIKTGHSVPFAFLVSDPLLCG